MKKITCFISAICLISACGSQPEKASHEENRFDKPRLETALASQDDEAKQRFSERRPLQTLQFFGIAPGDTVVEMLPGQGWYTKILLPYLGSEGRLIGVDYAANMWTNFPFGTPEFIEKRLKWPSEWSVEASAWSEESASVEAYSLNAIPNSLDEQVDAVLFIRALHNLARFEGNGGFLTEALERTYQLLKPGGVVGIVQHSVDETYDDDWADGSHGYLKLSFITRVMEKAGFEFVAESQINRNDLDQPRIEDSVWRLPPSLSTSKDDPKLREEMQRIGESNRATLLFRKPH